MRLIAVASKTIVVAVLALSSWAAAQDSPMVTGTSPEPAMPLSQVTITGTGFGATQSGAYVEMSNYPSPTHPQIVSWSDTQIVIQHSAANGGGAILVRRGAERSN